jgi:hypothetical protein
VKRCQSGSGQAFFHTGYQWPKTGAVVHGFPAHLNGRHIAAALSSVGFSSPPHRLKCYAHLSNGQKFRCELALSRQRVTSSPRQVL